MKTGQKGVYRGKMTGRKNKIQPCLYPQPLAFMDKGTTTCAKGELGYSLTLGAHAQRGLQ